MRCSIIRRVSTEEQSKKISLSDQLKQCQQSIQQRGWQFIQDFNFAAAHGAELQHHPTYMALKQHIEADETDVLLTAVLDRALRDTSFWIDLCGILQQHHKLIATPVEIFDPQNLEHELTLNIKSAVGHFERKKIRERAIMGLNALKDQGGWTGGKPPFGYHYDPTDRDRPLKIQTQEAELLKRILDLTLKMSKLEICHLINSEHHKFRKSSQLTPRMIRRFLERYRLHFYAGLRLDSKKNWIPANWDPIITKDQLIRLLDAKKSRTTAWQRNPAYLLTGLGIFRCGYCGLSIKTTFNTKRSTGKYYYCSGYYRGRDFCKNSRSVNMEKIDNIIIQNIVLRMRNINKIMKSYEITSNIKNNEIEKKLQLKLSQATEKKNRLIDAVEQGILNFSEIELRIKKIRQEIDLIETKISELYSDKLLLDPKTLYNRYEEIIHLPEYELPAKREIIQLLIEKIILFPKNLYITYRFPINHAGKREVRIEFEKKST